MLLIERSISPHFHDLALTLCRDAGLSPRIVLTESTVYDEAAAMMAASGKGVFLAVGKSPCHPSFADRLVALPLRETLATLEVHVAWRRGESSSTVLNFIETTRASLQRGSRVLDMRNFPRIGRPASASQVRNLEASRDFEPLFCRLVGVVWILRIPRTSPHVGAFIVRKLPRVHNQNLASSAGTGLPVSAASSTGRCNTIQCADSTMLLRGRTVCFQRRVG